MSLALNYPPELPIVERREDLLEAIRDNQVVVVAGETGSGKSTQLPKLCLELGRGDGAFIGHTQPRRLAARSVAERIAEELDSDLGGIVGYTVRFTDEVGPDTRVKVMTDGILLAEIQRDRALSRYDTIIIDEAHERSLNIDFLLGYLKQLLPSRPDLKVIITSATIDTERFSEHFDGAPVIEVSGRTFPVEMRYEELRSEESQVDGICDAVRDLTREGPGDILVFLSGEADIRDAEEGLRKLKLTNTEIFPLFARLSAAEQHRVFEKHQGRRVVLATNVAETSLTVPGVRYVVDPGNARISRYSFRTKVQRLPIESISQASANQRSGRCGRVGPGICIRLYSEEDYDARPAFTEPEIQRTNLASVILQMASLDLGPIESFPFVDPPDDRSIRDGVALLVELGALDPEHAGTKQWLTRLGRRLAKLPLDPRLARMVIEADRNACLDEVLIIVSGMSVMDPRERPPAKRTAADEAHQAYAHADSDFLSWLELWAHLNEERRTRSSNQFRRWCRQSYIHFMRTREWQDIHRQLRRVCRELKLQGGSAAATPEQIHRSILAGLVSQIGMKDPAKDEYRGARGARFTIARGSTLYKRSPDWVMAGELVETNRLWARSVTRIRPEWVEDVAPHLVERSHGEAWWATDRASAYADERVVIYGLPLIVGRPVSLSQVDRAVAREMFIHHALIEGEWDLHFPFMDHNAQVMASVQADEARQRRDMLVDYDALYAFYDERLPADVVSGKAFERWWKEARSEDPKALNLSRDVIVDEAEIAIDVDAFPEAWHADGIALALDYEFDPTSSTDGVTVNIPVSALNQLNAGTFEWNVPGLREELVTALIRTMPKQWRKLFVPVPETVAQVLPRLDPGGDQLLESLRRELSSIGRRTVPIDALALERVDPRLRPTFRVVDEHDRALAESKDLRSLDAALEQHVRAAISQADSSIERAGLTTWDFGALPKVVETEGGGHMVRAFPAVVDEGDTVAVRLVATQNEQRKAMKRGVRRLLMLQLPTPVRPLKPVLTNDVMLSLSAGNYGSPAEFTADCHVATLNALMDESPVGETGAGWQVWDATDFDVLLEYVRDRRNARLAQLGRIAADVLLRRSAVDRSRRSLEAPAFAPSLADVDEHIDRLVYPGFVTRVGADRLGDVDRYMQAVEVRLEKLPDRVAHDRSLADTCRALERDVYALGRRFGSSAELSDLLWQLEEFRVSAFAQQLGTRGSVSEKRIRKAMARIIDP